MRKAIDAHQRRIKRHETCRCWVKVINQVRGIWAAAVNLVARSIDFKNHSACIRDREDPYIGEWVAGGCVPTKLQLPSLVANLETLHAAGFRLLAKPSFRGQDQFTL